MKKLKLAEIRVTSFVTALKDHNINTIKGGTNFEKTAHNGNCGSNGGGNCQGDTDDPDGLGRISRTCPE